MNFKKFMKIVAFTIVICFTVLAGVYSANYVLQRDAEGLNTGTERVVGKRIHMLLMATDKGGLLTDTIMVASFDKERNIINVLSIPRDTRIKIGNSYGRVNSAYAMGTKGKRQELAIQKINEITGLPIHYYMVVDPKGFGRVVDVLDGVEIDVPERMYYVDPTQDLVINLRPGLQVLDGDKAEQFCRYRGYADADLGRIRAQQTFVKALFEQKLKPEYIAKAGELYTEINKHVQTNVGLEDIFTLLPLVKMMNKESLTTYQLPGRPQYIGDVSYFIYDREETDHLINQVFLNHPSEEEEGTSESETKE